MDTITTSLTVAWLDAFRRIEQPQTLLDQTKLPQQKTLTDAIEGALRTGGSDSSDPGWSNPAAPSHAVDKLA